MYTQYWVWRTALNIRFGSQFNFVSVLSVSLENYGVRLLLLLLFRPWNSLWAWRAKNAEASYRDGHIAPHNYFLKQKFANFTCIKKNVKDGVHFFQVIRQCSSKFGCFRFNILCVGVSHLEFWVWNNTIIVKDGVYFFKFSFNFHPYEPKLKSDGLNSVKPIWFKFGNNWMKIVGELEKINTTWLLSGIQNWPSHWT